MNAQPLNVFGEPASCRHLRSKQFHMDIGFHPSGMDSGAPVPCWCLKTMQPYGPDDEAASADACDSGRSCFEPDGA